MTFHHFRHGEFSDIIDFLARVPSDFQALIKCSHSNTQWTSLSNDTALQCLRVFQITASAKSIYHSLFASCRDLMKFPTAFQSVPLAGCPSPLSQSIGSLLPKLGNFKSSAFFTMLSISPVRNGWPWGLCWANLQTTGPLRWNLNGSFPWELARAVLLRDESQEPHSTAVLGSFRSRRQIFLSTNNRSPRH